MTHTSLALIPDFDLSAHNTLALGARSRLGASITEPGMVPDVLAAAAAQGLRLRILGGGSNVVLAPEFDGITAVMAIRGRRVVETDARGTLIEVAAGENWHELVTWTVAQGLGGVENLAGIPGTVGAAPVQNIGAYGVEVADVFETLVAYDCVEGRERVFVRDECAFAYRDSLFKREPGRFVVLSLRLRLPQPWVPRLSFAGLSDLDGEITPKAVMDRVLALRGSKLPDWRVTPNAGSFFQNPIVSVAEAEPVLAEFPMAPAFPQADGRLKLSAGWLIEKSGLKGFRLGPVGMSERHALVLVNYGGAVAEDVAALAEHVKRTVRERFGVQLHEEPVFC
ncbi:UDP-N-acetylmuramate dehydrogenase [Devosia ginsengisoli]|uniref:UDP-N-acetylmuramate dehydrogenase n=1 Tax=Devosia ginsengisoli TaxID=400770 RepID=UPI0026F20A89|nr:UDP-N-acetylmuramate dehydrogenase [Devosia ginsengisoli]MCR6672545.1 UDP-N-acetylmuramate dehydrogenase [Devosia ginsengisoli]